MKPALFADLLQRHAEIVRLGGEERTAHGLEILSDGFRSAPGASVATALKRIKPADGGARASQLADSLAALAALLEAAGAKAAQKDVVALAAAWAQSGGDASVFAADLQRAPARKAPAKAAAISAQEISGLAKEMKGAIGDPARFSTILDKIVGDKRIKKASLQTIAEDVLGYPLGGMTGPKIVERLRDRPRLEAYQRSKREVISKINV